MLRISPRGVWALIQAQISQIVQPVDNLSLGRSIKTALFTVTLRVLSKELTAHRGLPTPEDVIAPVNFIDYEYAVPAPAAFDISNHLAEWTAYS
jgi:hypothetical protein